LADEGRAPLLQVSEVTLQYKTEKHLVTATYRVSFDIYRADRFVVLGPSGCGKSTLLRMITGLNRATHGTVLYRGAPVNDVNPHATIVFQTFALYPWLTVEENVEVALKARGVPPADRRRTARHLIDIVGLDGFESAYPRELSGGMRQKVGFARAMAVEPELLCLDEPFSALDVLSAEALRGELLELWLNKSIPTKAILLVTHNIEEAVLLSDRIVVMAKNPGRVLVEIPVPLRHPRQRTDTAFQGIVDSVYAAVAGRSRAEAETLAQASRVLPKARLNALAGLVEKLAADGGRADFPRLASDLSLELDDLLPIVEAGELVGFCHVQEGDLLITPLGQAYAEASILARKELVAGRILRVPMIRWIFERLQRDDDHRVDRDFFLERLGEDVGVDNAEDQLDLAISWGRFAELFSYDKDTDELFLEA
jgi:NitT/TauT family transport system ATP-binding protein